MSLAPQAIESSHHKPREVKFNCEDKFQSIHSIKPQNKQTGNHQIQTISRSRTIGSEAKKKLKKKII